MSSGKVRVYSLSVNVCKAIIEDDVFEVLGISENESSDAFDMEIGKVKTITFYENIVELKSVKNEIVEIQRSEYKEIIIP